MQLTEMDKSIIRILNKDRIGLTEKSICSSLQVKKNSRGMINKRLNILTENGVVDRIEGYPKLYYIRGITDSKKLNLLKIKCPRCGQLETIRQGKITKVCVGCKHRYWITDERITASYNDITH